MLQIACELTYQIVANPRIPCSGEIVGRNRRVERRTKRLPLFICQQAFCQQRVCDRLPIDLRGDSIYEAELASIAKKGIKTAKVVQERAEQRGQRLKLPAVDTALRSQLDAIKPQLAGKALQVCS